MKQLLDNEYALKLISETETKQLCVWMRVFKCVCGCVCKCMYGNRMHQPVCNGNLSVEMIRVIFPCSIFFLPFLIRQYYFETFYRGCSYKYLICYITDGKGKAVDILEMTDLLMERGTPSWQPLVHQIPQESCAAANQFQLQPPQQMNQQHQTNKHTPFCSDR